MIGGGLDSGFLQFMSDKGNYYALAIGILGIAAITAGIGGILLFAVLAISFLVGFLVALGQNLDLLAKGCPKEVLIANLLFTIAVFLVGSLAKIFLDALVRTIGGWIHTSIVPSVGNLCKYK